MGNLINDLAIALFILSLIAVTVAVICFYLRSIRRAAKSRSIAVIDGSAQIAAAVAGSKLEPTQQAWINTVYLPRLTEYRRLSQRSGSWFRISSKLATVSPYLAGAVALATTTVFQSHWLWGGLIGGLLVGIGKLFSAFDGIDNNSTRWLDYQELAFELEDSLTELLTESVDQPIHPRWQQFRAEYELIRKREQELFARQVRSSQAAATASTTDAQSLLTQIKQQRYHHPGGPNENVAMDHPDRALGWRPELAGDLVGDRREIAQRPDTGDRRLPRVAEIISPDGSQFETFRDRLRSTQMKPAPLSQIPFPDDDDLMPSEALNSWQK